MDRVNLAKKHEQNQMAEEATDLKTTIALVQHEGTARNRDGTKRGVKIPQDRIMVYGKSVGYVPHQENAFIFLLLPISASDMSQVRKLVRERDKKKYGQSWNNKLVIAPKVGNPEANK